jgi:hypothetical protein
VKSLFNRWGLNFKFSWILVNEWISNYGGQCSENTWTYVNWESLESIFYWLLVVFVLLRLLKRFVVPKFKYHRHRLATSKIVHTKKNPKNPSADWTYNDSRILVIVGFINLNVYTNVVYFRKLLKTSETISCYDKSQGIITCYFDFWYSINISWLVNVKYTTGTRRSMNKM